MHLLILCNLCNVVILNEDGIGNGTTLHCIALWPSCFIWLSQILKKLWKSQYLGVPRWIWCYWDLYYGTSVKFGKICYQKCQFYLLWENLVLIFFTENYQILISKFYIKKWLFFLKNGCLFFVFHWKMALAALLNCWNFSINIW